METEDASVVFLEDTTNHTVTAELIPHNVVGSTDFIRQQYGAEFEFAGALALLDDPAKNHAFKALCRFALLGIENTGSYGELLEAMLTEAHKQGRCFERTNTERRKKVTGTMSSVSPEHMNAVATLRVIDGIEHITKVFGGDTSWLARINLETLRLDYGHRNEHWVIGQLGFSVDDFVKKLGWMSEEEEQLFGLVGIGLAVIRTFGESHQGLFDPDTVQREELVAAWKEEILKRRQTL